MAVQFSGFFSNWLVEHQPLEIPQSQNVHPDGRQQEVEKSSQEDAIYTQAKNEIAFNSWFQRIHKQYPEIVTCLIEKVVKRILQDPDFEAFVKSNTIQQGFFNRLFSEPTSLRRVLVEVQISPRRNRELPGRGTLLEAEIEAGKLIMEFPEHSDFSGVPERIGPEFQVNTNTTGTLKNPSVASFEGGSFVSVWIRFNPLEKTCEMLGQMFDETGAKEGPEFLIPTKHIVEYTTPKVLSFRKEGSFGVIWDEGQGLYEEGYLALFNDGTLQNITILPKNSSLPCIGGNLSPLQPNNAFVGWPGDAVILHSNGSFTSRFPIKTREPCSATALSSTQLVVLGPEDDSLYGEMFSSLNGTRIGHTFEVSSSDVTGCSAASLNPNEGIVVIWRNPDDGTVYGQRISPKGSPIDSIFPIAIPKENLLSNYSVIDLGENIFTAWQSKFSNFTSGVFGKMFSYNTTAGSQFKINADGTEGEGPSMAALGNDTFVVVWEGKGKSKKEGGIRGQIFNSTNIVPSSSSSSKTSVSSSVASTSSKTSKVFRNIALGVFGGVCGIFGGVAASIIWWGMKKKKKQEEERKPILP